MYKKILAAAISAAILIVGAGCSVGTVDVDRTTTTAANVINTTSDSGQSSTETTTSATYSDTSSQDTTELTSSSEQQSSSTTQPISSSTTTAKPSSTSQSASGRKIINLSLVDWNLVLANGENQLPAGFTVNDVRIKGQNYGSWKPSLDYRVAGIWDQMYTDALAQGINLTPNSAYRSIATQRSLFNAEVKRCGGDEAKAAMSVMYPGCSDHNLGLAVDVSIIYQGYVQNGDKTAEYKWLDEHAADYGFILRYPKDKVDITKVKYEPWHWRYVGVEAAKEIKANKWCLEEYHIYKGIQQ